MKAKRKTHKKWKSSARYNEYQTTRRSQKL